MKAEELRIGNLINLGNRIGIAIEIHVNIVVVTDLEKTQDTLENIDRCKPIPLTEQWLIDFGAEKVEHKENQYRLNERLIVIREGFFYDYGSSVKLEFVHTIQNLYYALTNQELTYNPKQR